jgi:hypothetical protein
MTDTPPAAWELEQEARAINATDWQSLPGMVKRQCDWCRYWFAAPAESHDRRCPDCGQDRKSAARVR